MQMRDDSPLISIGTFASLGGVSIKALRLYADLGLLPPAHRAAGSRYRLYSRGQLATLHRILLLKSVGIPLGAMREHLEQPDRQVLSDIRRRLVLRLEETRRQLAWVDAELNAHAATAPTIPTIVVKQVPKLVVRSQRQRLSSYDETDELLDGLGRTLPTSARAMAGAVWHDCSDKAAIDCEAFWVVSGRVAGNLSALAPVRVASAMHRGPDATIGRTYEAIRRWIAVSGFEIAGPNREIYIDSAEHHTRPLTEVQFPIREHA